MSDDKTISSLIALKETLVVEIDAFTAMIKEDRVKLEEHKRLHGDFFYRPSEGAGCYGDATDTLLEPVFVKLRASIKAAVELIDTIDKKLDAAKASISGGNRPAEFDAQALLNNAAAGLIEDIGE